MPKRTSYESDGGFVEDAPKDKKHKAAGATGSKKKVSHEMQKDDDGNEFWEISRNRRVGISTFKDMKMVNIREYYEKDGKSLPGKKGISLTIDQFTALVELLPSIETALKKQGVAVPRPNYDVDGTQSATEPDTNEDENSEQSEDDNPAPKKKTKKNHEATDDEEE